eukprot:7941724-Alexandrium_andersonii.AAC.1
MARATGRRTHAPDTPPARARKRHRTRSRTTRVHSADPSMRQPAPHCWSGGRSQVPGPTKP